MTIVAIILYVLGMLPMHDIVVEVEDERGKVQFIDLLFVALWPFVVMRYLSSRLLESINQTTDK